MTPPPKKRRLSPAPEDDQPVEAAPSKQNELRETTSEPDTEKEPVLSRADNASAAEETSKPLPTSNGDRAARFAALKARATASSRSNLAAATEEAKRSAIDPTVLSNLSRRSAIAQHKLLKADTEADEGAGAFERRRAWDYTIEESEKWDERMERKSEARENNVFRDWGAEANKIYERQVREMEKDGKKNVEEYQARKVELLADAGKAGGLEVIELASGELVAIDHDGKFYTHAHATDTGFVEQRPKKENVDRLVDDLRRAEEVRLKKRQKRGLERDEAAMAGDVSYINEKNKTFNLKLGRFYDRYTKDVRDAFERGTAL